MFVPHKGTAFTDTNAGGFANASAFDGRVAKHDQHITRGRRPATAEPPQFSLIQREHHFFKEEQLP